MNSWSKLLYKTLYALMPLTIILYWQKLEILSFISAAITMCILSGLLGKSMGQYEYYSGPAKSALLNSFVGNIAELVIALFALFLGDTELVKGSVIGSILGNLLVVIGACFIVGAWKWKKNFRFKKIFVRSNVAVLLLVIVAMSIPSICNILTPIDKANDQLVKYSLWMAGILFLVYIVLIVRNNTDHSIHALFSREQPVWTKAKARLMVLLSAILVVPTAYILVKGVERVSISLGINELVIGMFFISIIANIPENSSAVRFAYKGNPNMAMAIPLASCIQLSLFVVPIIVLVGYIFHHPFIMVFSTMQIAFAGIAFLITQQFTHDGFGTRFFGFLMIIFYICLAIGAIHLGGIK